MSVVAYLLSVLLASCVLNLEATEFMGAQRQGDSIAKEVVKQVLLSDLSSSINSDRIATLRDELQATFAVLPKNEIGQLEPSTVRYILHRHFVQKYKWYVKGLDPEGNGWNSSSLKAPSADVMKGSTPAYIQMLLETRMQRKSLDLEGVAVFAATLEDLIFQDSLGSLRNTYAKLGISTDEAVPHDRFDLAIRAYLSSLIAADYSKFENLADVPALEVDAEQCYPEYKEIIKWFRNLYLSRNPLVMSEGVSFDRAGDYLRQVLLRFATVSESECRTLKKDLVKMEQPGTGRVLLSDFYANRKFQMHQSVDYLRNQGALEDEGGIPRLIIPNYISSPGLCMPFSSYHLVCCPHECDGLIASLERGIGQPSATPARVAELVSALPSDTVSAPRELPSVLMARLNDISSLHGGLVPLHGRLFMQWMHHAYPSECPYPHAAGTTNPVTQDQWLRMHAEVDDAMATPEEMALHANAKPLAKPLGQQNIPWSLAEELVAVHKQGPAHAEEYIRIAMCLIVLLYFALLLTQVASRLFPVLRRRPTAKSRSACVLAV